MTNLQQLIGQAKKEFAEKFSLNGRWWRKDLSSAFKTVVIEYNKDIEAFLKAKLREAYKAGAEGMRNAIEIKVLTPSTEPPPNNLSQNQIFGSGQMNAMIRINEKVEAFLSTLNPPNTSII